MPESITLTREEANELLMILSEIPIKYMSIVQKVMTALNAKFMDEHASNATNTQMGG